MMTAKTSLPRSSLFGRQPFRCFLRGKCNNEILIYLFDDSFTAVGSLTGTLSAPNSETHLGETIHPTGMGTDLCHLLQAVSRISADRSAVLRQKRNRRLHPVWDAGGGFL